VHAVHPAVDASPANGGPRMNGLLLLAVLMVGPEPPCTSHYAAAVEINHYHDDRANYVFTQAIFYDIDGLIIDWRMVKCADQIPTHGKAMWYDGETLRKTVTASTVETYTMYDPEVTLRESQPKESRKLLTTPPTLRRAKQLIEGSNGN
jgi:hypothetical protein